MLFRVLEGELLSTREFCELIDMPAPDAVEAVDLNCARDTVKEWDVSFDSIDLEVMRPIYLLFETLGYKLPSDRLSREVERNLLTMFGDWQLQVIGEQIPQLGTGKRRSIYLEQVREFYWLIGAGEDHRALQKDFESGPPFNRDNYLTVWDLPVFTHSLKYGLRSTGEDSLTEKQFRGCLNFGLLFIEDQMAWTEQNVFVHKGLTVGREIFNRVVLKLKVEFISQEVGLTEFDWSTKLSWTGAADLPPFPIDPP